MKKLSQKQRSENLQRAHAAFTALLLVLVVGLLFITYRHYQVLRSMANIMEAQLDIDRLYGPCRTNDDARTLEAKR